MYETIRPKTEEEWLSLRTNGIGSSEVATILGVNKFESPRRLWERKRGERNGTWKEEALSEEQSNRFELGHYLEPFVAMKFEDKTGYHVDLQSEGDWIAKSDKYEWMQASPDRLYQDKEGNICILEIKTTNLDFDAESLPMYYYCQLQYQLGIMELKRGAIAWLNKKKDIVGYREFEFDEEFFLWMVETLNDFWNRCIIGGEEPDITTESEIADKYPKSEDVGMEIVEEDYDKLVRVSELNDMISQLEDERDSIILSLKKLCGECDRLTYNGVVVCSYKSSKDSEVFDSARFKEEHPELFSKYVKTRKGSRPFKLKL